MGAIPYRQSNLTNKEVLMKNNKFILGEGLVVKHEHEIFEGIVRIEIVGNKLPGNYVCGENIRLIAEVIEK